MDDPIDLEPSVFSRHLECEWSAEGEWYDDGYTKDDLKFLVPRQWPGKKEWLRRAYVVQQWMKDNKFLRTCEGCREKSLITGEALSSSEFSEGLREMSWKLQHVEHNIDQHYVAPTRSFFRYILNKYENIIHPHSS